MTPLLLNEVANDVVHGLAQEFPISEYILDCVGDPAQTISASTVIGRKIADLRGRGGIAHLQFLEYPVLQRMVVGIGIDLKISDNGMDDLVVGAFSPREDVQLPLKNEKQLFDVAMFLAQDFNNHCALPEDRFFKIVADIAS